MNVVYWTPKFSAPWYQKINPVFWCGNLDDPVPPAWFNGSRLAWFWRNPFHNLMFYCLGLAGSAHTSYGKEPDKVFIDGLGWNWSFTCGLPFVSHRGTGWRWYAGWKCPNGSLGFELRRNS